MEKKIKESKEERRERIIKEGMRLGVSRDIAIRLYNDLEAGKL